ncbi:MAG TPA: response regulator [Candidatus Acidoferrum sp.]|jgi:two-component system cell cycle sensor histidine kinase/response regulator CckA|nr:response regulator [Candidatus Acidoferrum sp.]
MPTESNILLVDDEPASLKLLSSALALEGYTVLPADKGELALTLAIARPPHLILLDIRMGGMGGFEVCRRLKSDVRTRDVPLIFLSSSGMVEERVHGLALGAVDFIVKPFPLEELLARVRTHLELGVFRAQLEDRVARRTDALRQAVERLQVEVEERRRAESALRENQELTRMAMQAGRTYAFEWNPHTDELRRSYNCAEILGLHGDVTRDRWDGFIRRVHPEDRASIEEGLAGLTPDHDTWEGDYRRIGSEGQTVYLHVVARALFDADGRLTRYIGIAADVTAARRAEAALHESEARFQNMADTAPMMICASGPDKLAIFFNRAWLTFTGRTLQQELGYGWTEGVHPEDLERCLATYSSCFEARRTCHLEYRLRCSDGDYRWLVCNGVPRFRHDGVFDGYIASFVDITDVKRAQEETFDRQKLDSLRLLTGGIAHDFNNLLGGILVEAEMAATEIGDSASALESIARIRSVATRAAEMVRELMIYAGQDKATLEAVNLSHVVEDMVELMRVTLSKHALLKVDLAGNLPPVLANSAQMRQVVMNLVLNASHAIANREGEIRISTSKSRMAECVVMQQGVSLAEGEYVWLQVSDSGCGMTEETRNRIFEPFFTTKGGAGHGLGLAVVQGIVRSHGGAINVTSSPGRGTTFEVLLPCASELTCQSAVAAVESGAGGSLDRYRIVLLVEDEETLRIAIGKALRKRGVSVLSVADGQAAVELFESRAQEIDAVVLDLTLPGISGLEVLRQIRGIKPVKRVILTSAYDRDSAGSTIAFHEAGVDFLRKPYAVGDLLRLLQQSPQTDASQRGD